MATAPSCPRRDTAGQPCAIRRCRRRGRVWISFTENGMSVLCTFVEPESARALPWPTFDNDGDLDGVCWFRRQRSLLDQTDLANIGRLLRSRVFRNDLVGAPDGSTGQLRLLTLPRPRACRRPLWHGCGDRRISTTMPASMSNLTNFGSIQLWRKFSDEKGTRLTIFTGAFR